jgi:hypothetical protein
VFQVDAAFTLKIRHAMFDKNEQRGICIAISDDTPIVYCDNLEIWGCSDANNEGWGFIAAASHASSVFENMSIYDCQDGFRLASQAVTVRNIASFGNSNTDYLDIGSANGYNCTDSDGTAADGNWSAGSGNLTGITPSSEFESLSDTSEAFLDLKRDGTGQLSASGTTPGIAENTAGIRLRPRPDRDNNIAIGASQLYLRLGDRTMYRGIGQGVGIGIG